MISIGSGIFNLYYEASDFFIENPMIGKVLTIVYESREPKSLTYSDTLLDFSEQVKTEDIKIRMYHNPRDWKKLGYVDMISGRVQVIGYMTDAIKLQRATYMTYSNLKYKLGVQPVPHGFGSRYFVAYLDLI